MVCCTFNYIDLGEGEVDGLRHGLNLTLQLSIWQRSEFIKQRGDVVCVDSHQNLESKIRGTVQLTFSFFSQITHSANARKTDQWDDECEEPGIDEEVITTDLDDVEEQWCHWQQNTLSHSELLESVFQEETQCL